MGSNLINNRKSDTWVVTSCNACFNNCAIRVHRKDGKIVDIKGDPIAESSLGKICGKGMARIADLYNPQRITKPLKRTNPEKGINIDPQWEEISWEEALDTITEKLKKIRAEDPRKLVISTFDLMNSYIASTFGQAFGTPNYEFYPVTCGNGLHTVFFLTLGTLNSEIDLEHCNYIMLWGSQLGHGVNNNPLEAMRDMANARRRGAKLVVVDPICGHAAAKADEWIPIRPGTDGALALGMLNVLLNDLKIYDKPYLKTKTNAPYLIDNSGHYVRDKKNNKPMIWDAVENIAKVFDADDIKDFALEGKYTANSLECRPAFALLKEHVKKKFPLEKVSGITTIPVETIARLAREFGEAAQIGSTIELEGETMPLRPSAIEFKRGLTHHKHGFNNCYAPQLLNIAVGNMNMPGGLIGTNPNGPEGVWRVDADEDGMLITNVYDNMSGGTGSFASFRCPYPPDEIKPPESLNLRELFPVSGFLPGNAAFPLSDPEKFRIPYKPEMMIICRQNMLVSNNDPKAQEKMLRKLDFILMFAIKIDETSEMADIILPEAHDFEKHWFFPANPPAGFQKPGPGDWYYQAVQPVLDPPPGVRNWIDVMIELAERVEILPELNTEMNKMLMFGINEESELDLNTRYSIEELSQKGAELFSMMNGQEVTPELFTENIPVIQGSKKELDEAFAGPFMEGRVPIYLEHFIDVAASVKKVTQELGMTWWDTSHYTPLIEWKPCPAHESGDSEYDLYATSSRLALHGNSISADNPWVDDICRHNRLDYNILLNTETGNQKGIKDGDTVVVKSKAGKVKGKVRLTGCVHHETVGVLGGNLGQWAKHKKIAKGKGIHFNSLASFDWDHVGTVTGQLDNCAKVKIYKTKQ